MQPTSAAFAADAQRKLDAILNNASVAIFMMDANYECVYMNPAAVELSGYTLDEMRGRPLHDIVHHSRPDGRALPIDECPIGRSLETQAKAVGEEVFVHKDGSFYPVAYSAAPMRDEGDTLLGTVLEVRDIRQEKETLQSLHESDRAKDEFLAMLGHELRNPLSPIVTSLSLLKLRGVQARELDIIGRQVEHLSRLVDDLLDISRVTRGLLELRKSRIELAAVMARSLEVVRPMLERRRQDLQLDMPEAGLMVEVDTARLSQVLTNVLVNASKFSPAGSCIEVRARVDQDRVRVSVLDRGEGIPPEMLERIFAPFAQSDQAKDRPRGGLGLGLAIARNLVHLHGGTISARSPGPGAGSEFTIELPVAAQDTASTQEPLSGQQPAATGRPMRVLVVDDNRDAADVLKQLLEVHGHTVVAVYDAADALHQLGSFEPEVALLDVGLPVMDGHELARSMRQLRGAHTPILVALTGYGLPGDRRRSQEAGFRAHLVKPVEPSQLLAVLEQLRCEKP